MDASDSRGVSVSSAWVAVASAVSDCVVFISGSSPKGPFVSVSLNAGGFGKKAALIGILSSLRAGFGPSGRSG